jgi:Protein of unknown function (DUF3800)
MTGPESPSSPHRTAWASGHIQASDYIVYVDESGDHGLSKIDPSYPMFVLAFCIFEKRAYAHDVVPRMLDFKFEQFGHDQVVLHEHDIKKAKGEFRFMTDATRRQSFMEGMNTMIAATPMTIVAVAIRKNDLVARYNQPNNPYLLAMEFVLERVSSFLSTHGQIGRRTYVVFERRGAREDTELELEFRRVTSGQNPTCSQSCRWRSS